MWVILFYVSRSACCSKRLWQCPTLLSALQCVDDNVPLCWALCCVWMTMSHSVERLAVCGWQCPTLLSCLLCVDDNVPLCWAACCVWMTMSHSVERLAVCGWQCPTLLSALLCVDDNVPLCWAPCCVWMTMSHSVERLAVWHMLCYFWVSHLCIYIHFYVHSLYCLFIYHFMYIPFVQSYTSQSYNPMVIQYLTRKIYNIFSNGTRKK